MQRFEYTIVSSLGSQIKWRRPVPSMLMPEINRITYATSTARGDLQSCTYYNTFEALIWYNFPRNFSILPKS